MSDIAVKVEGVGKKFSIDHQKSADLRNSVVQNLRSLLGVSGIRKEEFWALREISFEIKRGEAVGIIGRNGAGKSTLLKILARITEPTTGRFEINGRVSSLLEVGTGFHPELTGRDNVYLNGTILGMKRKEIKIKFDEIVAFSGVEKFIDTPVKHFSSGMKVRLAFSVAAHLEPEILIVDEVLAVGDAEFQKKCLGKMDEVSKTNGRVVLFVSHNMSALKSICSKGFLIGDGRMQFQGDVNETIEQYFSQSFHSEYPGVLKAYKLNDHCFLEEFSLSSGEINVFNDLSFKIVFNNSETNRISEVALLFYNNLNERVAIIDLRHLELHKISSEKKRIVIEGKMTSLPLIEGNYHLGIYIASNNCTGNFLDLLKLTVTGKKSIIAPYPINARGVVEIENEFKIYG